MIANPTLGGFALSTSCFVCMCEIEVGDAVVAAWPAGRCRCVWRNEIAAQGISTPGNGSLVSASRGVFK